MFYFVIKKPFMEMGVESFCASLWKTRVKVDLPFLVKAYSNIFCFGFEKASDRKWVLDHGPWCIKGDLLVMMSWSSSFGIKELSFNTRRLWIQIHNLPHDLFFRANANLLGAQAGRDVSIELDESKLVSWNNWIRVQVEIEMPLSSSTNRPHRLINSNNFRADEYSGGSRTKHSVISLLESDAESSTSNTANDA
ncbi:hypothetical protein F8388_004620 [Cannabis sativa]|uniref:DUF4283 domain-containing protein n=1 Tax=Cannabis sativa TaxID=3483 RepID=A0A7J6GNC9_CANSA|nr:hypothetical protein F8388_004620 [Cannabis sativa]